MKDKINVVFFQRKPYPFHKSLEFIFSDVRARLPKDIISKTVIFSHYSSGVMNRIRIVKEASSNSGDVNHITGDIHFADLMLKKKNTILTVLDCGMLAAATGIKKQLLRFFWFTLPVKKAAYITVISTATKQDLLRYVQYDPWKILVIPVAISSSFTYAPKEFNRHKPVLLQIGTTFNKNISRLIEAIRNIPCHLNIVGKLTDDTKSLLEQYHISYNNFTDLSDQQIIDQYKACDIVTFCSTYEGFGMPIVEANATGRAVITSNILSMPEVAGNAAHMVDPYDVDAIREGVRKLIHDDRYRNDLIGKGQENCKRFDPAVIAGMYVELYRKVYNESTGAVNR